MKEGVWYHPEFNIIILCENDIICFQPSTLYGLCSNPTLFIAQHAYPDLEDRGWMWIGEFD